MTTEGTAGAPETIVEQPETLQAPVIEDLIEEVSIDGMCGVY